MPWVTCTRCDYVPVWLPDGSTIEAVCSCCSKGSPPPEPARDTGEAYPTVVLPDC